MAEIPREYWEPTKEKWEKIKEKVKNGEKFVNSYGFEDLTVMARCGYCYYFSPGCFKRLIGSSCSLYNKRVCCSEYKRSFVFYQFVDEMQKDKPDFEVALEFAQKILDAINEDTPI